MSVAQIPAHVAVTALLQVSGCCATGLHTFNAISLVADNDWKHAFTTQLFVHSSHMVTSAPLCCSIHTGHLHTCKRILVK